MIRQLLERKNRFLILGQDYDHHALNPSNPCQRCYALAIHGPIAVVYIAMTTTSVRKGTCVMVEGKFFLNDYRFGRTIAKVLVVTLTHCHCSSQLKEVCSHTCYFLWDGSKRNRTLGRFNKRERKWLVWVTACFAFLPSRVKMNANERLTTTQSSWLIRQFMGT